MYTTNNEQDNYGTAASYLDIVKQTSISEEKITKRGKTTNVYVVVKNSPFQITVGLKNSNTNFNYLAFDMSLLYDMPGMNKEVAYVSTKPIDLKSSINDVGDEISFDVKIKVLSSHHEDNHFRLKIVVWDSNDTQFPAMTIFSHPIKVISKPMGQRKPRGTKRNASAANLKIERGDNDEPSKGSPVSPNIAIVEPSPVLEMGLARIDAQQQESLRLLNEVLMQQQNLHARLQEQMMYCMPPMKRMRLSASQSRNIIVDNNNNNINNNNINMSNNVINPDGSPVLLPDANNSSATDNTTVTANSNMTNTMNPLGMSAGNSTKISGDFESSFTSMLRTYIQMDASEKAERVRRILRTFNQRELQQIEELFDIMATAGIKPSQNPMMLGNLGNNFGAEFGHSDACEENCPHKVELSRIDQFYSEVFF